MTRRVRAGQVVRESMVNIDVLGEPLLQGAEGVSVNKTDTRVYAIRWWLLAVFGAVSFEQGFIWAQWSPIATAVGASGGLGWFGDSSIQVGCCICST